MGRSALAARIALLLSTLTQTPDQMPHGHGLLNLRWSGWSTRTARATGKVSTHEYGKYSWSPARTGRYARGAGQALVAAPQVLAVAREVQGAKLGGRPSDHVALADRDLVGLCRACGYAERLTVDVDFSC